jgi:hypothetical protein
MLNDLIKLELVDKNYQIPNYDELVVALKEEVKKYQIEEVNEDTYKLAKTYKSTLNNLIDSVNSARITAEKKYMEPFNIGKDQCKTLIGIAQAIIDELDKGIKSVDDSIKSNKLEEIRKYFNSVNIYPIQLEDILDRKWLNKTTKLDDIKKDIDIKLVLIKNDINDLKNSIDDKEALKTILFLYFITDMNLTNTLLKYEKYLALEDSLKSLI